jgi:hypothetical protein
VLQNGIFMAAVVLLTVMFVHGTLLPASPGASKHCCKHSWAVVLLLARFSVLCQLDPGSDVQVWDVG